VRSPEAGYRQPVGGLVLLLACAHLAAARSPTTRGGEPAAQAGGAAAAWCSAWPQLAQLRQPASTG